ncbi:pinopsin-like isoform X2 [Clavelina lepadiformis]|uniref:G-protein coupled receptors family 1 profile domain-containing protein n=1 Tax=Clavelina lepadiformis TaxID=159417 RepID=A0ABP0FNH8_CLALP
MTATFEWMICLINAIEMDTLTATADFENLAEMVSTPVTNSDSTNPYVLYGDGWVPDHIQIVSREYYTFISVYMTVLSILSCFFNSVVIVVTIKYKELRKPINYIIVNLAVADLASTLIGCTIPIFTNAVGYFYLGKYVCQFLGYTVSISSIVSLLSISVMAFERFVVICKPFGSKRFGRKQALLGIAFTWTWSIIWNTPPLVLWDGYVPEGIGTSCAPNWLSEGLRERIYLLLYFITCFFIPLAVIAVCYWKILAFLREFARNNSLPENTKSEAKVTKLTAIASAAFLFAWLPYAGFSMYKIFTPGSQMNFAFASIPAYFAKSSHIYNPFIYVGLNRQFCKCVMRMFVSEQKKQNDTPANDNIKEVTV